MNQPERTAARAIVKWMRQVIPGSIVAVVANEQRAQSDDKLQAARFGMARKASGIVSGFPDIIALLPGGRTFLLEVKRPPQRSAVTGKVLLGKTSEAQEALHPAIRAIGHQVDVATCIDTARAALFRAGIKTIEAEGQPMPAVRYSRARAKRMPADAVPW